MTDLLLALLLLATPAEEPQGRVCVGERRAVLADCTKTSGLTFAVAPSERERLFVWTSADEKTAHLGTIAPKATSVTLDAEGTTALQLTIDGDRSRGWPADVEIAVTGSAPWRWKLDAKSATRLRSIIVPHGRYGIRLKADRHRALTRAQIDAREENAALGELRLVPLPVARGIVVDAEGKGIGEAVVSRPDASFCATSNEQGAFECELGEPTPEALVVARSGLGPRELYLGHEVTDDVDLGSITLTAGRTLTLKIVRPAAGKAKVTLFHDADRRYEHSRLKTHELRDREEEVRFDASEGKYLVLVEGEGPLERLEVPIEIKDADAQHTITVEPFQLQGTVRFGDEPMQEGRAEIVAPQHSWRATLPVRGGAFGGTMWQTGKVRAFVDSKETGGPEMVESPKLGDDPTRWDVHIEKRMIVGRVLDAETRMPVTHARFQLTAVREKGKFYTSIDIQPDGSYRILANRPGKYGLRVNSPEHVAYMADIQITAEDKIRTHDIALQRGVVQPLEIVTPAGAPVPNAVILEGVQSDRHNPLFMANADGRGHYALRGRGGETRVLTIVSRDGSFAVARVQVPRTAEGVKPLQVVMPPLTASLRLRTVDAEKKLTGAGFLLRYNGEFLPPAHARFATAGAISTHPSGEIVLPRLPAGTYEIWAFAPRTNDEENIIASGGTLRAPVRVGLSAGEQTVTVAVP